MTIEPLPFFLVIFSALLHASWNLIVKKGRDGLVSMAMIKLPNMVLAITLLVLLGLPARESWPYVLSSAVVNCIYFYCLINAYRTGDLGVAYPVSRGLAPLLVLMLSLAWAREVPTPLTVAGVCVICLGIVALAHQRDANKRHVDTLLWAVGTSFTIAIYTVTDGIGARLSGNPVAYVAMLNLLTGIVLMTVALRTRGMAVVEAIRTDWKVSILGGSMVLGAYMIAVYAMTLAPMATVAALRECSVIFAAILGTMLLKEPFGARRIAAAAAVAAGIGLLVTGR